MKKIALATLLAASAAIASAQVTVSGKIGEYMDRTKTGSTTVNSLTAEPTSSIKFTATEALGNGLTARVILDTKILANDPTKTDTQVGDRQSTVGLANALGSIDLGRNYHSIFNTVAANDAFSAMYGTIAKDIHTVRDTRFSNGVFVSATPFANGKATYERSNGNVGGDATAYSFGGKLGMITATVARYELGAEASTVLAAGTTLGSTQVNAIYSDNSGASNFKGTTVSAVHALAGTAFSVKGSYGSRTDSIKAYNMGVDYAFSKNTVASVVYRNVNAPGSAADINQVGVGLLMKF
jgi:predicted porin